ncbi:MAG TPA: HisA/HisF-related TIM barrel protein, partial [Candidatus Lokiarchaeia archaeon]
SIDMFQEKLITKMKLDSFNPLKIISLLDSLGVKEIILLDLFRVGQKIGGIPPLYLKIREIFSGDILVGGGIKDFNDILNYKKNNFSGVLIGTAFYDGSIKIEEIIHIN